MTLTFNWFQCHSSFYSLVKAHYYYEKQKMQSMVLSEKTSRRGLDYFAPQPYFGKLLFI